MCNAMLLVYDGILSMTIEQLFMHASSKQLMLYTYPFHLPGMLFEVTRNCFPLENNTTSLRLECLSVVHDLFGQQIRFLFVKAKLARLDLGVTLTGTLPING